MLPACVQRYASPYVVPAVLSTAVYTTICVQINEIRRPDSDANILDPVCPIHDILDVSP